jgi:hypothetical protein
MRQAATDLIIKAVPFLRLAVAREYREFLAMPLQSALRVIEGIEIGDVTIEEIATESELAIETVRQIVRCLKFGGYPIETKVAGTQGNKHLLSIVKDILYCKIHRVSHLTLGARERVADADGFDCNEIAVRLEGDLYELRGEIYRWDRETGRMYKGKF